MLQTPTQLDLREDSSLSHAIWAALEKIGAKQKNHKELSQGSRHKLSLQLSGEIDGDNFSETVSCTISIGHEFERNTSTTPHLNSLLAFILSKLNQSTRDYLLRTIPEDFASNDQQLPSVDDSLTEQAELMLSKLRASKRVNSRAAVRVVHSIDN